MPIDSSIYWDSIDSQRSTSGGSSGGSSGSTGRHYVDPWDLENYAYLRRHSVAGPPPQPSRRGPSQRLSRDSRARSEHWCASLREPGYDAPAFVEEFYYGPPRQPNNGCYYHQPIYEDEVPDYVAPFPVYAPLSEVQHPGLTEDHKRFRHRCKSRSMRDLERAEYLDPRLAAAHVEELDDPRHHPEEDYPSMRFEPEPKYVLEVTPPPHLDLNTYGHLKIDYTNSWNSLNRKIGK